ncbi:MAG: hypothetical protein WB919_20825 [Candidatus Sulfotelmatobacter sp.]
MRPHPLITGFVWGGRPRPRTASSKTNLAGNSCGLLLGTLLIFCVLLTLAPSAVSQRAVSHAAAPAHAALPHSHSPAGNLAFARSGYRFSSRRSSPYASPYASPYSSLPFPFFGDSFDPDDIYSSGYPVASQPPPFLMEALREMSNSGPNSMGSAATLESRDSSPSQPLMIELQNGRYVRVNSAAADGDALPLASSNAGNSTRPVAPQPPLIAAASPAPVLPPVVLIFRDGHNEEVRDYTIADGILYARGDYYTDGYWTKKIGLSTLNLNQTLQANADRNIKFVLPASPNEVITRP